MWTNRQEPDRALISRRSAVTISESPNNVRIGWIGTGIMGASMCSRLLEAGYPTSVFTRTKEKATALVSKGAEWKPGAAEVAADSDITFAIVGFPGDVREVFLSEGGVLDGARPGSLLVDMTTSEPKLALEIHEAAAAKHVGSIDAPVSGGDVGARNGTLSIMVGGNDDEVKQAWPQLEIMGSNIVHVGGPGAGQHTKMVNQILIASGMLGVCEGLLYAQNAGLDMAKVLEAVGGGAAGSWSLSNYGPRMLKGDFDPGFYVDHFVKDMGIALDEASAMQVAMPGLALANQLYVALQAQGGGRKGTQALLLALARLSYLEWSGETEVELE